MDSHELADPSENATHSPTADGNSPAENPSHSSATDTNSTSDQSKPSEDPSHSSSADAKVPEKRKREPEPAPENSSEPAPPQQHPLWKTTLCSYFRRTGGSCSHGESCRYAHGEEELRQRPDNTWDPTSERAKKMAKIDEKEKETEVEEGSVMMTEALGEGDESSSGLSKCFVNLPMKWSADQLRKFLSEQGILFKSAKKKKGMTVGFVTFEDAAQVKIAVKELDGKSVGNNRTLKVTDVIPRPFEKNNKVGVPAHSTQKAENPSPNSDNSNTINSTDNDEADGDGSLLPNGSILKGRSARDVVTPLAHLSYSEQLEHKKNSLAQILKKLTRNARKACPNGVSLPEWIMKSREIGGLPCKLEGIIESPLVNGYRNKCEFSVGYSLQGKSTVGFLLGNFREGVTAVEEPVDCPNVSRIACKYAAVFQEFLQHSLLPLWNRLNNTGFWRQLTVREGRRPCQIAEVDNPESNISEVLLMVQVCTVGFDDGQVKSELEGLAQAFSVGSTVESPPLPLTALVIQDHTGISNAAPPDAPLRYVFINKGGDRGLEIANDVVEPRIHDHLSNLRFSISPSAFFQVNTLAAEKLYSLAGDWAGLGQDTLLFDVCCGTGTIGLTLAHRVGMVVGIEMNASAVSDAQRNAEINGIKNCRFVCGKAEDVIGSLMKEYLSLPQKQDVTNETLQNKEAEVNSAEENVNSADCGLGTEDNSSGDHENGCTASKSDDDAQMEKLCALESKSTPVQQFKNVVAIVDPPRVGLHPTVIKVLRTQSRLRRLVYISCNPESLVANAIELCTPSVDKADKENNRNNRGWRNMSSAGLARHRAKSMPNSEPFTPIKAMAVDLFPHTPHCELVMLLER
ncbi:tRNA (uracil(54)-C(5))-methyltransferase [Handroanthus impetiginosus]|uniref:tRNA (Uracil(54)-C(5))-methyltransferase n=1 Tax=Handroanthus impetiginosus TaxID=429701 RepID=A0A2G9HJ03_9LAMI|nr:tRNA (uracil(54)-C(5))-methyltransferase [Handroanthus impetiginosus]